MIGACIKLGFLAIAYGLKENGLKERGLPISRSELQHGFAGPAPGTPTPEEAVQAMIDYANNLPVDPDLEECRNLQLALGYTVVGEGVSVARSIKAMMLLQTQFTTEIQWYISTGLNMATYCCYEGNVGWGYFSQATFDWTLVQPIVPGYAAMDCAPLLQPLQVPNSSPLGFFLSEFNPMATPFPAPTPVPPPARAPVPVRRLAATPTGPYKVAVMSSPALTLGVSKHLGGLSGCDREGPSSTTLQNFLIDNQLPLLVLNTSDPDVDSPLPDTMYFQLSPLPAADSSKDQADQALIDAEFIARGICDQYYNITAPPTTTAVPTEEVTTKEVPTKAPIDPTGSDSADGNSSGKNDIGIIVSSCVGGVAALGAAGIFYYLLNNNNSGLLTGELAAKSNMTPNPNDLDNPIGNAANTGMTLADADEFISSIIGGVVELSETKEGDAV